MDPSSITVTKPSRSAFIQKLHELLEAPEDPENLSWLTPDSFQITVNETRARKALSQKWDFRSLSSFIRQLSYYNFKRLSDRRRSTERRSSATGYIVFSHPSGHFVQGDNTQLSLITRKARNRPDKAARRAAKLAKLGLPQGHHDQNASFDNENDDDDQSVDGDDNPYAPHPNHHHQQQHPHPHPHPHHGYSYETHSPPQLGTLQLPPVGWPAHDFRPQPFEERKPLGAPVFNHSWGAPQQGLRHPQPEAVNQWRWTEAQQGRRSSIPHIPLGITPIASQFANAGLGGGLGGGAQDRPTLRKAHSALSIHTTINEESSNPRSGGATGQDDDCSDRFQSPYPTPTLYPPAHQPGQSVYATSYFPGEAPASHSYHDARRESSASHYVSSGLVGGNLPSPTQSQFSASPPNEVVALPPLGGHLDPRALHAEGARRFSMPQPVGQYQPYAHHQGGQPQQQHHQLPQWGQPMQLPARAHEY